MDRINKYFLIGTFGMAANSGLHIILENFLSEGIINTASSLLYPVFIIFLLVGTVVMIKRKRQEIK